MWILYVPQQRMQKGNIVNVLYALLLPVSTKYSAVFFVGLPQFIISIAIIGGIIIVNIIVIKRT
jgi:hypothetical protein